MLPVSLLHNHLTGPQGLHEQNQVSRLVRRAHNSSHFRTEFHRRPSTKGAVSPKTLQRRSSPTSSFTRADTLAARFRNLCSVQHTSLAPAAPRVAQRLVLDTRRSPPATTCQIGQTTTAPQCPPIRRPGGPPRFALSTRALSPEYRGSVLLRGPPQPRALKHSSPWNRHGRRDAGCRQRLGAGPCR